MTDHPLSRRDLLSSAAGLAGIAWAGEAASASDAFQIEPGTTIDGRRRLQQALAVRQKAARLQCEVVPPRHEANGDEAEDQTRSACFSKGLPHEALGLVDPKAYDLLLRALRSGNAADFERIPISGRMKLGNPQAAMAYSLIGPDPCLGTI